MQLHLLRAGDAGPDRPDVGRLVLARQVVAGRLVGRDREEVLVAGVGEDITGASRMVQGGLGGGGY